MIVIPGLGGPPVSAALAKSGAAEQQDSPPAKDTSPEHSPIKPHSGRSPTPQIVDQLLGEMMEDAFTPRWARCP